MVRINFFSLNLLVTEPCPYCGKPFKRLKSHLPYCKMSPASKTTKSSKTAKKPPLPSTPKDPTHTDSHKNVVNVFDKKLNYLSSLVKSTSGMKAEKVGMDEPAMAKVTGKSKRNWLAKREQEMAKQAVLLTQMGNKRTADSQQKLNCFPETTQEHIKGAPETERKNAQGQKQTTFKASPASPLTSQVPASKSSVNGLEKIHASLKALSNPALTQRVTEQASFCLFQTKTSVWNHINHGLYNRRSGVEPGLYSTTQEVSVSKFGNISVQRPVDDVRTSASHVEISSNEGSWTKCQSSRVSSQSQGKIL